MRREQIEKLVIDNIVRIYRLIDAEKPTGFPEMSIQQWRNLIQVRLSSPELCSRLGEVILSAKNFESVHRLYTDRFLDFIINFLNIRIKKLSTNELPHIKGVANSEISDKIEGDEIKRISCYLNRHKGARTLLKYELYESYKERYPATYHSELVKTLSALLGQDVEIEEVSSFTPKDYRVQTKYLEENLWVFIPALPQIIIKLKC